MRLKVILKSKNKKIPKGNRFMIISLIKKAIELGDEDLFNELYFFEGKKNKQLVQIGNAVPPVMAWVLAKTLLNFLPEDN